MTYNEAVDLIIKQNSKELKELKKQYFKFSKQQLVDLYSQRIARVNTADTLPKSELIGDFAREDMILNHRSDIQQLRNDRLTRSAGDTSTTSRGMGSTTVSRT